MAVPDAVLPGDVPPRFEEARYFLPFRPNVLVTYVNRARLREAGSALPRTTAALRNVAAGFQGPAGRTQGHPAARRRVRPRPSRSPSSSWASGAIPLVLNDAGSVAAFEFLAGLWREGLLARESLVAKYDTQVDNLVSETAWLAPNWPFMSGVLARQDLLDRFEVYAGWRGPACAAHVVGGDVLASRAGSPGAVARARSSWPRSSCPVTPRSASSPAMPGPRSARMRMARFPRRSGRRSRPFAGRSATGGTAPASPTGPRERRDERGACAASFRGRAGPAPSSTGCTPSSPRPPAAGAHRIRPHADVADRGAGGQVGPAAACQEPRAARSCR